MQWYNCRVFVGGSVQRAGFIGKVVAFIKGLLNDFRCLPLMTRNSYDILIVKDKFLSGFVAILFAKLLRHKSAFWISYPFAEAALYKASLKQVRFPGLLKAKGHIIGFIFYRCIAELADHIFVQTDKMKEVFAKKGVSQSKMTPIPMGVDLDNTPFFGYASRPDGSIQMAKRIVYMGSLAKVRNIDFILNSFKLLRTKHRDAKLILIGGEAEPDDRHILDQLIRELRLDGSVTITGFLPQEEAWKIVQSADVCLSPLTPIPILEWGFPTKLIEYMAMGKAVVGNDHPEQMKILSESDAGICVPYEEEPFADAIDRLLNQPLLAVQMGLNGQKYVRNEKGYDKIVVQFERQLLKVAG